MPKEFEWDRDEEIARLRAALDDIFRFCVEDGDETGTVALIRETADKALNGPQIGE